jgi:prepilin-type N-terminal cleavage/methylation domain-containing protein
MRAASGRKDRGFTLIEAIIVIVAAAILGVMMFTYSNTSLLRSSQPLHHATKAFALQRVMENIVADYHLNYKSNLAGIKTKISDPASQQNPPDGYGPYTLVFNDFIKFVGNVETPLVSGDPQNILKVTIKNDLGETLTMLLAQ